MGAAIALVTAAPQTANAACAVSATGSVNCNADTTSTETINIDGGNPSSSARTQRFHNGAAITGAIQPGVTVSGFGLELTAKPGGKNTQEPITVDDQGQVTTGNNVNALQLSGDGGSISYAGDGSISNTNNNKAALDIRNVRGDISAATGNGAISGATGINARTTKGGALTITTGSGLISGGSGPGVQASTRNGALAVTVGTGGVVSHARNNSAITATSTNGNISVTANGTVDGDGTVAGKGDRINLVGGAYATSNGNGNITIGGSGTFFGQYGRAIWAEEGATGLGGILITGSGATIEGSANLGCCSAIRAEIDNPADSSNVIVDRTGNVTDSSTLSPVEVRVSAAIHAITAGTGNVIVDGGSGATISNTGLFGIDATAFGQASSGSIKVSTATGGAVGAIGTGILAENEAYAITSAARSTIAVTANGTINSGPTANPVGFSLTGGSGSGIVPAGILAGYDGGPIFGPASGRYTSCGVFGCTTLTPNPNVNGTVNVVNNAVINAAGDGIFAFNFGNGSVSVTSMAPIIVAGATSQNGIGAFSAELGNISVATSANVTAANGSGIRTSSAGTGTTTINVIAGTTQGGTSGVTAASASGAIQINNWATI